LSDDLLEHLLDNNIDVKNRTIFLPGEIDDDLTNQFIKNLHYLKCKSKEEITIGMILGGGSVVGGLSIYDAIVTSKDHHIKIIAYQCMSMAVAVLQAADERVVMPNTSLLLHYGKASISGTHRHETQSEYNEQKRLDHTYYKIISERSELSIEKVRKLCDQSTYVLPKQAIEYGLADKSY